MIDRRGEIHALYFRKVKNQRSSTSSGFIIEGKRILSNAHGASNCSLIHVRKHGDPKKYPGRILHIAHECDLVILTVDDEKFWKNVAPLELSGRVPRLQESITVVGYPIGKTMFRCFHLH